AEAPAPAPAAAAKAPAVPAAPLPEYVTDPGPKSGIPYWMMPILLILPLWAIMYMGAFGERATHAAETPQQLYTANCASCHGASGQGGVGPPLSGGVSKLTFPDEAAQIAWVENGSSAVKGQPYGSPDRPGGQKIATSGGMPGFKGQLTDEQIKQIVTYERDTL
ncbi:MAG: c-type cytochrome, partial [Acidimicrobiales bacterium]